MFKFANMGKKLLKLIPAVTLSLIFGLVSNFGFIVSAEAPAKSSAGSDSVKLREEIEEKYKWNLKDIFSSDEEWEARVAYLEKHLDIFEKYRGKLSNPEIIKQYLADKELTNVHEKLCQCYHYTVLKHSEDCNNSKNKYMKSKMETIYNKYSDVSSFVITELSSLDEELVKKELEKDESYKVYTQFFNEIFLNKNNMVSADNRNLTGSMFQLVNNVREIFEESQQINFKFEPIKDETGNMIEITNSNLIKLMSSQNQEIRKQTFFSFYKAINGRSSMLAAPYKQYIYLSDLSRKMHNHNSVLEMALKEDNVNPKIIKNLIDSVHNNSDVANKYNEIIKKQLNAEKVHEYDFKVPIYSDPSQTYTYEQAQQVALEALAPLGTDYISKVKECFEKRWIDVYNNQGKDSGAYALNVMGVHPYILMNFNGSVTSVFTLVHEIGHCIHARYSDQTQKPINQIYSIFSAEIASTVNEFLLMDYFVKKSGNEQFSKYWINEIIRKFFHSFIHSTLMTEFEIKAHELAEKNEPITAQKLNNIYFELQSKYFGSEVEYNELASIEWAFVSHIYRRFYCYKYATGYAAASVFAQNIINGNQDMLNNYISFLSSGGSDYPVNLLKKCGIDMESPELYNSVWNNIRELTQKLN